LLANKHVLKTIDSSNNQACLSKIYDRAILWSLSLQC